MAYFGVIFFADMGGGGGQKCFQKYPRHQNNYMQFLFSGINFLKITITITFLNP